MWKKSGADDSNQYEGRYRADKKNGYGEFKWSSGSTYKGHYVADQKRGYGEMYWADGTIYKGYWDKGLQHGVGLMIFKDGQKKAGFFEENVYKKPLTRDQEFENFTFESELVKKVPENFRSEISDYLTQLKGTEDYSKQIGKQLTQ